MKPTITYTLDLGIAGEVDCVIEYNFDPGYPDVWYMPNGDPGYPGEPASAEITKVTCKGIDLSDLLCDILNENDDLFIAIAEQESEEYCEQD